MLRIIVIRNKPNTDDFPTYNLIPEKKKKIGFHFTVRKIAYV